MPTALFALAVVAAVLTPIGPAAAQSRAPGVGKPAGSKLSPALVDVAAAATGRVTPGRPSSGTWAPPADNHRGGLRRVRPGEVVVDVHGDDVSDGLQGRLTAAGGHVLAVSDPAFKTITLSVPDRDLDAVAAVPGVRYVEDVITPTLHATCAPLVSEGDTQLQASLARSDFGVDGAGVKVGILSDSYDKDPTAPTHAAGDVSAGELPGATNPCGRTTPVSVVDDSSSSSDNADEGRAMAQIVQDLAPGASLAFATATVSTTSFANNITNLRNAGAKVIVDDVGWTDEPVYQDGPIAVSITNARNAGVTYLTAAGNENITLGGKDVGSYEALAWRATPCPAHMPDTYLDCYNFKPSGGSDNTYRVTIAPGGDLSVNLQWAQPWNGVTTDLDLCFFPTVGSPMCDVANNLTSEKPVAVKTVTNSSASPQTMDIVIGRFAGPGPRFKMIQQDSALTSVEYSTTVGNDVYGPTVAGHAGAPAAITAAAVRYNTTSAPEFFSSRGPVTQLFQPVPSTTALPSPVVVAKPDIAATDGGINSFFGTASPPYRFYGTSAAGPHAAAVAALLLQAKPSLTPTEVASILQSTASPVGTYPATAVGGGLVNADAALRSAVGTAPAVTSANAATFTVGQSGTFTVTTTGAPTPSVAESGALPNGVTFNSATNTLSGPPAAGTVGSYPITFTASNGVSPDANQPFTLTVQAAVPTVQGAAFYSDGTTAKSGASGAVITVYAVGLKANAAYALMTSPAQSDPSLRCTVSLVAVNATVRTSSARGFLGNTSGRVARPAGAYDVCFVAQDNSTISAGPLTFQVTP